MVNVFDILTKLCICLEVEELMPNSPSDGIVLLAPKSFRLSLLGGVGGLKKEARPVTV
jgi:hypothetical protein